MSTAHEAEFSENNHQSFKRNMKTPQKGLENNLIQHQCTTTKHTEENMMIYVEMQSNLAHVLQSWCAVIVHSLQTDIN